MPNAHPRPYHRESIFGDGPRRALDREQRARFRYLLAAHRRARRLSPLTELVGNALVRRLSVEGRCDPGHDTIAGDVGCCSRTVRRSLDALRAVGLLIWQRRIVRASWRVLQTSNAYLLVPTGTANPPEKRPRSTGGQDVRETLQIDTPTASPAEIAAAQAALSRRRASIEARLLGNGVAATTRG